MINWRDGEGTYGFENSHDAFLVVSEHSHHVLASNSERTLNVADFHGIRQHARQSEGNPFRVFLSFHRNLETITEINVDDLSSDAVKHEVRRVTVAQTQNVANHGHDTERSRVVCSSLEPCF